VAVGAILSNPANSSAAVWAQTDGLGSAVSAITTNIANSAPAVSATTNGTGASISASDEIPGTGGGAPSYGTGAGVAALLRNPANQSSAIYAETLGTGPALTALASSAEGTVVAGSTGSGPTIYADDRSAVILELSSNDSTAPKPSRPDPVGPFVYGTGAGVSAQLYNTFNSSPAIEAATVGTGSAVSASITNDSNTQPAVLGSTTGSGPGVFGTSDSGAGVHAHSTSGSALVVEGIADFSRSGLAVMNRAGRKAEGSVTVKGVALSHSSLILATPQTHVAGVCISAVVPDVSKRSFTIYLTTAVRATVKIAWFVVG